MFKTTIMDFCYWQPNKIDKRKKRKESQKKFETISNLIKMQIHENL